MSLLAVAGFVRTRDELDLLALVCRADVLGHTVIAPAQLPAGTLTALIGTPYFAWLLWQSRVATS